MPRIGLGLGLGLRQGGSIDAQAQAHFNRVIADGGVVPAGVSGTNAFFNAVKTIYGTTDIITAISVGVDAHYLGYKLGAGAGATSGQAVQKLYSCAGSSGDVVQTTAASQPLLLEHSGENYWFGSGVANNFCSAPDISIPTNSGAQIDFNFSFTANNDSLNGNSWWAAHDNGSTRPLFIGPNYDRTIRVFWNNFAYSATSTASFPAAYSGFIRVKLETVGSDMNVVFSTSSDGTTYTQLGSTITVAGAANTYMTNSITFSTNSNNGANTTGGKFYRITYKDANGVTRADFNPATYNASTSQTQWTSTTGEVWTINTGTATTGYKGALVDRTIVISDGVDDSLRSSTISLVRPLVYFIALKTFINSYSPTQYFLDGNGDDINRLSFGTNAGGISNRGAEWTSYDTDQLGLLTSGYINGTNASYIDYDNVNKAIGTQGDNPTMTALTIFKPGSSSSNYANYNLNTLLISPLNNSSGIKTAMYNYIRSLNNNAF